MNKRHYGIVQWVNKQGRQTLQAVADEFSVSVQTVRSDIRLLAEKGLVLRSHGEVIPFPHRENISFDQRRIRHAAGKKHIADLCVSKLADYQSIFLGSGSTVAEVANQLSLFQGLQVMTTNLHAARNLCEHPDCELTISGGRVRMRDQDVIGGDAMRFFQRYRADIGIFSVAAVNKQGHLFDFTDDEVMAREALVEHCHYRVLVIDSTKFDTESRCLWGKMSDYDCVITDQKPSSSLLSSLSYQGVEILY
ncbi:MAG: DeoR/GlpR family DNA-binding transcription regulator [Gammaproteobacteria bacterium]|nr:DeoR/GlpR family DNA-binding transcription regulator [Gammaproteobacteria bacterium]MBU1465603.1 DeoR/GlpR family DNA-binding transcription regulator [Gammaproteobacteria bacterium]MBU2023017.1 DeoR/GlpR family DNA-binding transcription regulator [Gammaproteobacteria bacterium]MBU2240096.1 DeoR/GlpR family DNA-binding transcription regulator [Gammaproteobacteria bacterium]MBU2411732.1 DeoR/GlpR family DNA-binding transcription regulator [Gammaproteobacteria bacterium]